MADGWYLFDGARQLGPLSLSELKHFLEVKSLPDVQVWREGLNEWAAPSDLPEFAPVEPPPIPTISEDGRGQGAGDDIATKPHRFNNFIAMNWRGTPRVDLATVVSLIGSTHSRSGLRVRSELDRGEYPGGVTVTDAQLATIRLERHRFHGDWNYTIHPATCKPDKSVVV